MVVTKKISKFFKFLADLRQKNTYTPAYRLVEINHTEMDEYIVTVQVIHKNSVFQAKPEEILANDYLVDKFSPQDIRALTYLGYLMINNPKYKILAQRLSEKHDSVLFALRKRGNDKIIIKTADEIMRETDIIDNLKAKDAQTIGYIAATENIANEEKAKTALKQSLECSKC
ncbi:MAG TPA: hypothetical protein VG895_05610 [Patescibacteria group bacterium]|nr:hypothetical protein [Gammaproteobacteria bacterium]HWA52491.1 hypothetical protein [Patescibacteria group bacterium]